MTDPVFDTIYGPIDGPPLKVYDPEQELLGPEREDYELEPPLDIDLKPTVEDWAPKAPKPSTWCEWLVDKWEAYSKCFNL